MSASQRNKGARWERDVARKLQGLWPKAGRSYGQCREGSDAPDVDGTPLWIECKAGAQPNVRQAVAQGKVATDERPVVAVTKQDRQQPLVTMTLDDWINIMHATRLGGLL